MESESSPRGTGAHQHENECGRYLNRLIQITQSMCNTWFCTFMCVRPYRCNRLFATAQLITARTAAAADAEEKQSDEEGECNYFIGRTYQNDWRKYMNPQAAKSKIVFNELYVDWDEDLTLTEGVFDAIIAGKNSVPILGSTLKQQSKLFKSIVLNDTPVYVALDLDAKKKASYLIENLIKYGAEVYSVDVFPYNDVGEMPKKEFLNRKRAARLMSSEDAFLQKFINSFNF